MRRRGNGRAVIWQGWWCGARDGCSFKMAVGMARFDATGGASPLPYEKRVG